MKKISRIKAHEKGLKTYYTGVKCIHGHLDERRVDNGICCECQRQRSKKYNDDHKEDVRARAAKWFEDNKERANSYSLEKYYIDIEDRRRYAREYAARIRKMKVLEKK